MPPLPDDLARPLEVQAPPAAATARPELVVAAEPVPHIGEQASAAPQALQQSALATRSTLDGESGAQLQLGTKDCLG